MITNLGLEIQINRDSLETLLLPREQFPKETVEIYHYATSPPF
jgi:hypothetical protein